MENKDYPRLAGEEIPGPCETWGFYAVFTGPDPESV